MVRTVMRNDASPSSRNVSPSDCSAVVLAAGLSSRMGTINKLVLSVHGRPLLLHVIDAITHAGIDRVVVVLGHEQKLVEPCLDSIAVTETDSTGISFVINSDYKKGQASSVTCGLNALSDARGPTLICLGDQPLIKVEHLRVLIEAYNRRKQEHIVIPRVNGQRGNPIIISEQVRQRVLSETHNPDCRRYIDNHPQELLWLDTPETAYITDLDTPEDVQQFLQTKC